MTRLFFLLYLFIPVISFSQMDSEKEIRAVLDSQIVYWDKGDLESFMNGYWNNDSLMFIGKNGVTYGYGPTLERYKKYYPDEDSRGKLTFDIIQVKNICEEYYWVLGKYNLKRNKGDASGHFTLLFKKINGKWKIVSDHSS